MIYVVLVLLGLCFGSFINALVWRLRTKQNWVSERSVCVHCRHVLGARDLMPVLSWLALRGRCRYCKKPISAQYPLIEVLTAALYVASYALWPVALDSAAAISAFSIWLVALVAFVALTVYDIKWMEIPEQISFPLIGLGVVHVLLQAIVFDGGPLVVRDAVVGLLVAGGLFLAIHEISKGRWIGGGDVTLGFGIGLLLGARDSLISLYVACLAGALLMGVLLVTKKITRSSKIPFGPFLVAGAIVARLCGSILWQWYQRVLSV